jgi:poly [ADP-ribose] polymerase
MSKEKAQEKYDDAISKGNGAYLLEQNENKPDIFQLSVGNLPPGKFAEISIQYVTRLQIIDGKLRFTIPTTLAPIYSQSNSKEETTSENEISETISYSLDLQVEVENSEIETNKIESQTHEIITIHNESSTIVNLKKKVPLNSDFVITAPIIQKTNAVTLGYNFTSENMKSIAVDLEIVPFPIKDEKETEFCIVIDFSASMGGGVYFLNIPRT